jgi:hypothetical protein
MSQTYSPPARATRLTRFILLVGWAAFTLVALSFVGVFGSNAPYADEWEFVPALLGKEPALPWLWEQHNEHRMPLPRAVVLGYFRLTHDFRTGMYLQVLMMSGLALWLMRLAEALRGAPHWADAFFPISLLHLGHWENFLMGYQVCFALVCVLATAVGVVALRTTRENAGRMGVAAGVLAWLLCLTNGSGMTVAVPVCAWLAWLGWKGDQDSKAQRRSSLGLKRWMFVALAVAPLLYFAAYFTGYHRPAHHTAPGSGGVVGIAAVTGQTLGMAFGIGLSAAWPVVATAMLGVGLWTLRVVWKNAERPAAVGLTAVVAGVAGVALAIGVGRGGMGENMGIWSRYAFLTWPLLALAYLAWVKFGSAWGKRWIPMLLCAAAALGFAGNTITGMVVGMQVKATLSAVEDASRNGWPPEEIVLLFKDSTQANQEERAVRAIPMLRDARIGRFAGK